SASQTAAAGESQWVLLRSRPSQRKTAPRRAVRGQADVGEGDRTGRASCQEAGSGADRKGDQDLSRGSRRNELVVGSLRPFVAPLLHPDNRELRDLFEARRRV